MSKDIDLKRCEERLFLMENRRKELYEFLGKSGFRLRRLPNPYVQTVYLLDDQQRWTMGVAFKARRYTTGYSDAISIKEIRKETFGFEIKQESDTEEKLKTKTPRSGMSLADAVVVANSFTGSGANLRPFIVVEYQREHFTKGDGFRITVDRETRFWFFLNYQEVATMLERPGEENILRIELKFDAEEESENVTEAFLGLENLGALPIISKKQQALNLLKILLDKQFANKITKEIHGVEIEAKMSVSCDPNALFAELVEQDMTPFFRDPSYPFITTTASVNHYWGNVVEGTVTEGAKALFRGSRANFVLKKRHDIVSEELGILEREEKKLSKFIYDGSGLEPLVQRHRSEIGNVRYAGHIMRSRKAIWLINRDKRIYHLSIDRCHARGNNPLVQIEIEYTGCTGNPLPPEKARMVIIEDTKRLAVKVVNFLKTRSPVVLGQEKFNWLTRNS